MQCIFRVDASRDIGTGHVMRCLTLAGSLREQGAQCRFISREHEGNLIELIRERGFETVALSREPALPDLLSDGYEHWLGGDWEGDAAATMAAFEARRPDWVVVDHYALDARWEAQIRPHCHRLMVIDDLANRNHECDLLLDQNAVADAEGRYVEKVPVHCHLMLGPGYALLQPQYAELHAKARPRSGAIQRVLVYFGGADTQNLTGLAVEALLALARPDIAVDVVVDPVHPHAEALAASVAAHGNFTVHGRLPTLAPLMMSADLAIGAGGATSWERCCLGLPALIITLAENQRPIAAELDRLGVLRWLGHEGEVSVDTLIQSLEELFSGGLAASWSQRSLSLVDGFGAARVGEELLLSAHTPLRARLAEPRDETLLLSWANDPLVRLNSFTQEVISPDNHHRWFQKRLADAACRIYVLETELGRAVGQVRFELEGQCWVINYTIAANSRQRGLGKTVLATAIAALKMDVGEAQLVASVKAGNVASSRIFESLHFVRDANDDQSVHSFRAELG